MHDSKTDTDHSITDRATHRHQVLTILTKVHAFNIKVHFYRSIWTTDVTGGRYLGIVTSLIRWWDKCRRKRKFEDQNSKLFSCCDVRRDVTGRDVASLGCRGCMPCVVREWSGSHVFITGPSVARATRNASPHGSL